MSARGCTTHYQTHSCQSKQIRVGGCCNQFSQKMPPLKIIPILPIFTLSRISREGILDVTTLRSVPGACSIRFEVALACLAFEPSKGNRDRQGVAAPHRGYLFQIHSIFYR